MAFWKIKTEISQILLICVACSTILSCKAAKELEKSVNGDLLAASSVAVNAYKIQSTGSSPTSGLKKYGYPFLIAPTVNPVINSRSDDDEDIEDAVPIAPVKSYGTKLTTSESNEKKINEKKRKSPHIYGAIRRQGYVDRTGTDEQKARRYKEPKYRNFDELESKFKPRRIDYEVPYSEYYAPPKSSKPKISQRDPYLSLSKEPVDTFYPVSKTRSYTSPYKTSGRNPSGYGSGHYEESPPYYGTYSHSGYTDDAYNSPPKYSTHDDPYNYQEDYTIESNKPIIGDIRKRLLDYAGASDLYEGEPDYLRQVALNKHKYAPISNNYYGYDEPVYKKSYREFPYVESKISLIKKRRPS